MSLQSLDEDCTLEEEDEGLVEDEDEIDQFNDDTFGAGAIGKSCITTPIPIYNHSISVQCSFKKRLKEKLHLNMFQIYENETNYLFTQ